MVAAARPARASAPARKTTRSCGRRSRMLQGLAAAVLLTSCLNLANMMLAFGSARQKEIAIRLAVGGARSRIVRQLLVQGLLLSLAGGALGLIAASWAAQAAGRRRWPPSCRSRSRSTSRPDMRVVLATFAFCTLATIAFGLWPALRLSRPDLLSSLKDQAGEVSGTHRRPHHRARRAGHRAAGAVARAAGAERPVRARRGRRRVRRSGIRARAAGDRADRSAARRLRRGAEPRGAARGARAAARRRRASSRVAGSLGAAVRRLLVRRRRCSAKGRG